LARFPVPQLPTYRRLSRVFAGPTEPAAAARGPIAAILRSALGTFPPVFPDMAHRPAAAQLQLSSRCAAPFGELYRLAERSDSNVMCFVGAAALKTKLRDIIEEFRVVPGKRVKLEDYDPDWSGDKRVPRAKRKELAKQVLTQDVTKLAQAQELLYASDSRSVLLVFQAMDAAGKDGTIKHVMSGINPQGCQVYSFKKPSPEELDHDFLWRCAKVMPERGRIGIFNRSYYEEVLVVKVHPQILASQQLPSQKFGKQFWNERYESINEFERHQTRCGTTIIKFFLNVSKSEQRKRFLERVNQDDKHWKFSVADVEERGHWDDYMRAYEDALSATSTKWAPWHIIPADNKWVTRASVAAIIVDTIKSLDLHYPKVTSESLKRISAAKQQLENEKDT